MLSHYMINVLVFCSLSQTCMYRRHIDYDTTHRLSHMLMTGYGYRNYAVGYKGTTPYTTKTLLDIGEDLNVCIIMGKFEFLIIIATVSPLLAHICIYIVAP